ncbi:alpha/beta hydrolase [Puteibacter caeruleilacunae]|nr:alpha/beta hydrolase [Puteibacter caeruleilacunae]
MSIYIISNREVTTDQAGKEQFKEGGTEHALPTFRIAEYNEDGTYDIINDHFPSDYSAVSKAVSDNQGADKLGGTSKMLFNLYKNLLDDKEPADVLFFIHGFANSFESNVDNIERLKERFIDDQSSPIKHLVYLSWPTRSNYLHYHDDQKDARVTGMVLARLYDQLLDFFIEMFKNNSHAHCGHKIHLAAHSMGNQVLKHMLMNLHGKLYPFFGEVLLLHSDVEDDVFEPRQPFCKLEALAERTHMYIHKSDDALWISCMTKNFNKRLGKRGPKNMANLNDETFVIDTTNVPSGDNFKERKIDHWGYIESDIEVADIIKVLNGKDDEDISHRKKRSDKYYILTEKKKKKK